MKPLNVLGLLFWFLAVSAFVALAILQFAAYPLFSLHWTILPSAVAVVLAICCHAHWHIDGESDRLVARFATTMFLFQSAAIMILAFLFKKDQIYGHGLSVALAGSSLLVVLATLLFYLFNSRAKGHQPPPLDHGPPIGNL